MRWELATLTDSLGSSAFWGSSNVEEAPSRSAVTSTEAEAGVESGWDEEGRRGGSWEGGEGGRCCTFDWGVRVAGEETGGVRLRAAGEDLVLERGSEEREEEGSMNVVSRRRRLVRVGGAFELIGLGWEGGKEEGARRNSSGSKVFVNNSKSSFLMLRCPCSSFHSSRALWCLSLNERLRPATASARSARENQCSCDQDVAGNCRWIAARATLQA